MKFCAERGSVAILLTDDEETMDLDGMVRYLADGVEAHPEDERAAEIFATRLAKEMPNMEVED